MFPFDLSFQDIFVLGVVLTVAGGYKKTFVKYSRQGGLFVGRAVGFIRQKRDQVFTSTAQKAEMEALQQQLSDAVAQMQYIRHDIRSSTRMSRAYMSQGGVQQVSPDPAQQGSNGSGSVAKCLDQGQDATLPFQASDPFSLPQSARTSSVQPPAQPAHHATPLFDESRADKGHTNSGKEPSGTDDFPKPCPPASGTPDYQRFGIALDSAGECLATPQLSPIPASDVQVHMGYTNEVKSARELFDSIDVGGQDGKVVYIDGVPLIPVSAADTGKLPKRTGPLTGSDIMEEALMEARVAREASAILRGQSN